MKKHVEVMQKEIVLNELSLHSFISCQKQLDVWNWVVEIWILIGHKLINFLQQQHR